MKYLLSWIVFLLGLGLFSLGAYPPSDTNILQVVVGIAMVLVGSIAILIFPPRLSKEKGKVD